MWSSALRIAAVRGKAAFATSSATTHVVRRTMAGNVSSTTSSVSFFACLLDSLVILAVSMLNISKTFCEKFSSFLLLAMFAVDSIGRSG